MNNRSIRCLMTNLSAIGAQNEVQAGKNIFREVQCPVDDCQNGPKYRLGLLR